MARIRTIKPEFPQSESMGRVSRDARLLFVMLWTISDDLGRARAASRMLASLLFPYDEDAPKLLSQWLAELAREHCIKLYSVDGNSYLQIEKWTTHQKIDKPSASKLPAPPITSSRERSRIKTKTLEASPPSREASSGDLVPRTKDLGPSISADKSASTPKPKKSLNGSTRDFDEFWASYPKKVAKGAASKAYLKALARSSPAVILEGAKHYARNRKDEDPTYTAHAATWLNEDRWLDEVPLSESNAADPALLRAQQAEAEFRRKHGEIE